MPRLRGAGCCVRLPPQFPELLRSCRVSIRNTASAPTQVALEAIVALVLFGVARLGRRYLGLVCPGTPCKCVRRSDRSISRRSIESGNCAAPGTFAATLVEISREPHVPNRSTLRLTPRLRDHNGWPLR